MVSTQHGKALLIRRLELSGPFFGERTELACLAMAPGGWSKLVLAARRLPPVLLRVRPQRDRRPRHTATAGAGHPLHADGVGPTGRRPQRGGLPPSSRWARPTRWKACSCHRHRPCERAGHAWWMASRRTARGADRNAAVRVGPARNQVEEPQGDHPSVLTAPPPTLIPLAIGSATAGGDA